MAALKTRTRRKVSLGPHGEASAEQWHTKTLSTSKVTRSSLTASETHSTRGWPRSAMWSAVPHYAVY
jgi:hypothetical protein